MVHAPPVKGRPWFSTPGKPGDRTLEQQLMGLEPLWEEIEGKTVLDVGCAEGLISIQCIKEGASALLGVDIRPDAVSLARQLAHHIGIDWPKVEFFRADVQTFTPSDTYDVVLMLAVLHKLKDPTASCLRLVKAAKDLVVIRLPPEHAPRIIDARSGNVPHDIHLAMRNAGFTLEQETLGPYSEWVGYYRRQHG